MNINDKLLTNVNKKINDNTNKINNNTNKINNNTNKINEITNSEVYSTKEIKTNETWIDGKPIYRIIFTGNNRYKQSYIIANLSSLSIDKIIKIDGMIEFTKNEHYFRPVAFYEAPDTFSYAGVYDNNFTIMSGTGQYCNGDLRIILEYTKK